jgi:SMODS-associating 4TM effector domain
MNTIPTRQNSAPFIRLLRARSQMYLEAASLQRAQLLLTVGVPMICAVVGTIWPVARPWVGVSALAITICDASWLDRAQRRKFRVLAKVAEQFDCELLELPWNAFAAGQRVDPAVVEEAACAWPRGDGELVDWYPPEVGAAAPYVARIVCQRANLWYDSALRRTYSTALVATAAAIFCVLSVVGLVLQMSLEDFAVTILTPAAPMMIWAIRDRYRQQDVAEANEATRAQADVFWDRALAGTCPEDECVVRSRELQDAIYARRSRTPLLFPLIFARFHPRMVERMSAGVADVVKQIGDKSRSYDGT